MAWQLIESAPKNKNVIGWGKKVGINEVFWDGKQWQKSELGSSFQLGPKAITHWHPLAQTPEAA